MPYFYAQLNRKHGRSEGMTRRAMIERSLAAAAAMLLSDRFVGRPAGAAVG
jgi:hypothetical protein